jgi:hypothetical protein
VDALDCDALACLRVNTICVASQLIQERKLPRVLLANVIRVLDGNARHGGSDFDLTGKEVSSQMNTK